MPAWIVRNRVERQRPGHRPAARVGGAHGLRPDEIGLYHAFQPRVKGKPLRTDRATDEPDGRYKDDARLPAFSTRTVQRDANAYADFCAADMCAANCVLNDGTKRYVHFIDQRAALYAGTFPVFDGPAVVADFRQRQRRRQAVANSRNAKACIQTPNPFPTGTEDSIHQISAGHIAAGAAWHRRAGAWEAMRLIHKLLLSA